MSSSKAKTPNPVAKSKQQPAADGPSPAVMSTYARANLVFERGEGTWLIATNGDRYLDFGSGVAVNALGHAHPKLIAALAEQAHKVWHTSNLYRVAGQEKLAQRLCQVTFADQVFFCNSGAEACEGAIKVARRYHFVSGRPERWRLVTFKGAFHGRTLATIASAGNPKHLEGFGEPADGFDIVPFGDMAATEAAIGPNTAGIMVEPTQGEGGVNVASNQWLKALRELCDKHGLLLVLDEVQTGMGRTGKLFAHEWAGFTPDVMAVAKGLGGGFPIGAVLATKEAAKGMTAGTHGSTFGGNPLAAAVGIASLSVLVEEKLAEHANEVGNWFMDQLRAIDSPIVAEVRGRGLLIGVVIKKQAGLARPYCEALMKHGILAKETHDQVVRFAPPLVVTKPQLQEVLPAIAEVLLQERVVATR